MVDSYSFGKMVVDGLQYTKDLILLPDGTVVHPWWRKSGHELILDDLEALLSTSPQYVVVGTGNLGMVVPYSGLCAKLESQGIRIVVLPTRQAANHYNSLVQRGEKVAACFHLTC